MDFLGVDLSPAGVLALLVSFLVGGLMLGGLIGLLTAVYRRGG